MLENWATIVEKDNNRLGDALAFYEAELVEASKEIDMKQVPNHLLIEAQMLISTNSYKRHSQWAELSYIYSYFETRLKAKRGAIATKIYEKCGRAISSTDMKYFIDSDTDIVAITDLLNKIQLLLNKFSGIVAAFEKMQWRISDVQKLITSDLQLSLIPING